MNGWYLRQSFKSKEKRIKADCIRFKIYSIEEFIFHSTSIYEYIYI